MQQSQIDKLLIKNLMPLFSPHLLSLISTLFCSAEHLLLTGPQSPVVEIGTNFTATCWITGSPHLTVDDLYWTHSQTLGLSVIAEKHYKKINSTAVQVTIPVTDTQKTPDLLMCRCKENSDFVRHNRGGCQHGIVLRKSCKCF